MRRSASVGAKYSPIVFAFLFYHDFKTLSTVLKRFNKKNKKFFKRMVKKTMTREQTSEIINAGGATLTKNGDAITFKRGYQVSRRDCYVLAIFAAYGSTVASVISIYQNGLKAAKRR